MFCFRENVGHLLGDDVALPLRCASWFYRVKISRISPTQLQQSTIILDGICGSRQKPDERGSSMFCLLFRSHQDISLKMLVNKIPCGNVSGMHGLLQASLRYSMSDFCKTLLGCAPKVDVPEPFDVFACESQSLGQGPFMSDDFHISPPVWLARLPWPNYRHTAENPKTRALGIA